MSLDRSLQAINGGLIPGLQLPLRMKDLKMAREIYNSLSDENENQDREKHLAFLCRLLVKFNVQDKFRIIDPHEHFKVPPGYHLIAKFGVHQGAPASLIETVKDETFNPDELCGHKFVFISGQGIHPYQFRRGPLLDTNVVDPRFFSELIEYFNENKITSLGLEYTEPQVSEIEMYETVFKEQKRMLLLKITTSLLRISCRLKMVPTCWRSHSKFKPIPIPQDWCGKDPDTGDHEPPSPKNLPANINSMMNELSLS